MNASRWYLRARRIVLLAALCLPCLEVGAALVIQVGKNFTASTYGVDSSAEPPDTDGAAGPNHFVEFINERFSVFDKSTAQRVQSMTDRMFWGRAGVSIPSNLDVTDPRVLFDGASQRWFASQVDLNYNYLASNRFLVAVSASADPTGAWKAFAFLADPATAALADFPTLGIDADGVYLSADMSTISGNNLGPTLVSIPKADLLAASPTVAHRTSFGILSYGSHGYILQPAITSGPATTGETILGIGSLGIDFLPHSSVATFSVRGAATTQPALSSPRGISVPPYLIPIDPLQPDLSSNLDDGDSRFSAAVYRIGDTVYAVHSTEVANRAAVQWFTIDAVHDALLQTGVIADSHLDLFYPSIAANPAGKVVIGCNGSSSNTFVSAYAAAGEMVNGRLTFGDLVLLKSGSASYQSPDYTGTSRWGDYSATSVDPENPNRFWTIQMFPSGPSAWSTQITELTLSELTLNIALSGNNLLLSWPSAATGFQLQRAAGLSPGDAWTTVSKAPTSANNLFTVELPATNAPEFFRLSKP